MKDQAVDINAAVNKLASSVDRLANTVKEGSGHPFHGNQYTQGSGAEEPRWGGLGSVHGQQLVAYENKLNRRPYVPLTTDEVTGLQDAGFLSRHKIPKITDAGRQEIRHVHDAEQADIHAELQSVGLEKPNPQETVKPVEERIKFDPSHPPKVGDTVYYQGKVGPEVEAEYRGVQYGMDGHEATVIVRPAGEPPYQSTVSISKIRVRKP